MNEIQIFKNQEFGAIRTMSDANGEPLFCAKRFKHWVTSEVLPSIRKQGGYMAALRFSTREYNGQVYQDIVVSEIVKL